MLAVSVWCVRTLAFPQDVSIAKYHVFGSYVSSSINRTTYPILFSFSLYTGSPLSGSARRGPKTTGRLSTPRSWPTRWLQSLPRAALLTLTRRCVVLFYTFRPCPTLQFLPINLFLPLFYLPCYQRHCMHAIARAARPLLRATLSSMLRLVFCHGCRQDRYHVVNK